MSSSRQLRLGAFMRPVSIHTAAWRYPGAFPDANFNFEHLTRFAQTLERGKFDAFFMADHLAVLNMPVQALKRSATVTSFDPLTLLPALAVLTEHIGLIATASTTYNEPYHVARKFASLDHISGGRAGWNVVTSGNPDEAMNFGLEEHVEHATRYRRAREFFDVVTGLWDSWADDAFIRDVEVGHVLRSGEAPRPQPSWRVSESARAAQYRAANPGLAGDRAGGRVRCGPPTRRRNRRSYFWRRQQHRERALLLCRREGPHGRAGPAARSSESSAGRVRRRRRYASRKRARSGCASTASFITTARSRRSRSCSAMMYRRSIRTARLPPIPESNASKSGRERIIELAERENLTVRQLAQRVGGFGGLAFVGTPATIADQMEEWLHHRRLRRLQRDVPLSSRRSRRFRRSRGARAAAARDFSARI